MHSSDRPGSRADHTCRQSDVLPYLVLLQAGFSVPRTVTRRAVRSYRTFCGACDGLALFIAYLKRLCEKGVIRKRWGGNTKDDTGSRKLPPHR